jgi:hypothetical protein
VAGLPALDGLTGRRVSKASARGNAPAPHRDDPKVSWGQFEFVGLDPDESQGHVFETGLNGLDVTQGGRVVGQLLELCQWPYDQKMYACIHWTDPSAAGSDDLTMGDRPVRLLKG